MSEPVDVPMPPHHEDDPVEESQKLDHQFAIIPKDKYFTKRSVTLAFSILASLILFSFLGTYLHLRAITSNTNEAVKHEIPGLERTIERREATIEEQQDVLNQSTDWIVYMLGLLQDNGIQPPEIIIRPGAEGPPSPTTTIP